MPPVGPVGFTGQTGQLGIGPVLQQQGKELHLLHTCFK